jgi:hypothetical protein
MMMMCCAMILDSDGVYREEIGVMPYCSRADRKPCVYVHLQDIELGGQVLDESLKLTPAEPRRVAANLIAAADAIDRLDPYA